MADQQAERWVSVAEATGILRKSERTIRRYAADDILPSRKDGARLLVNVTPMLPDLPGAPAGSGTVNLAEVAVLEARVQHLQAENARLWQALTEGQRLLAAPTPTLGWWDRLLGRGS